MTKQLKAAALCLAFVGLFRAGAQEAPVIPEGLRDKALSVCIRAFVSPGAQTPAWYSEHTRNTMPGVPVSVKLTGENIVILVQVTPYNDEKQGSIVIVTQGQVWVKRSSGELSYHSTVDTAAVSYGEKVIFFPLGRSVQGSTPMRLEIVVDHYKAPSGKGSSSTEKDGATQNPPPPRPIPPAVPDPATQPEGQSHAISGSAPDKPSEPAKK